ncbi:MAG: hypothetical protein A2293_14860 [Elusimicrobia bacterium RIFOXYB2_FULL_49_7]|nr:MAG: hypothetical protein A2293_14860 [Elusimicrobia bacterium RIFOXYB2_FULL_49_7]
MDSLFAENDIVTIHAGLNEATRGSVDYRRLSLMPKDGILINTARGPLVVEKDLARILSEGHINAGVDVIDNEDDWKASPLINLPNVIFTGHVLSQIGLQEKHCLQETALANLKRYLRGDTLRHPVTPERFQLMT